MSALPEFPRPDESAPSLIKLFVPDAAAPDVPPAPRPQKLRDVFEQVHLPNLDQLAPKTLTDYGTLLRHWEKLTGNPDVAEITRSVVKDFQAKLLAGKNCRRGKRSAATVNKLFRVLKPLIRCCWPKDSRNPLGLGACDYFLFPKGAPVQRKLPRDLADDEISRLFAAAAHARCPGRPPIEPEKLWRAYLVLHLNCGPRTFDLLGWRWSQITFTEPREGCEATVEFVAQKTGKLQRIPLNATCAAALRAIRSESEFVWPGWQRQNATHVRRTWIKLCDAAGVRCVMEDFRKTCNTRYQTHAPGVGPWILGHSMIGVNATNYWNATRDILRAMATFPQPACYAEWAASLAG